MYFLLKRKAAKSAESCVELFELTSGPKKLQNAVEWLKEQAVGISNGINIKSNNNIDSRIDSEANINNRNVDNVSTLMNSAADTESNERVGRMSPKRCFLM